MKMTWEAGKLRLKSARLLLVLLVLVGVSLLVLAEQPFFAPFPIAKALSEHSATALVVAGLLGLIIDESLKQELLRDAVAAALGYVLPEPLKRELRWVYDQKVMAQQSFQVRLEHFLDQRRVRFHGTVVRRIENVCGQATPIIIGGGADEWFSQFGETNVAACEMKRSIRGKAPEVVAIMPVKEIYGVGYNVGSVTIAPDEVIETLMSYTLDLPDHGMELLTYRFAIDRPLVTVEAPPTLRFYVTFAHRSKYDQEAIGRSPSWSIRLDDLLMPHQDIRVYWHRSDDVVRRAEKYSLAVPSA